MIFLHCALPAEARSLIDFYKLKQVVEKPFRVYQADGVCLVVSGIGKTNTSAALGFLYGRFGVDNAVWLNVGICGAKGAEIGTSYVVNKAVEVSTGESLFPPQIVEGTLKTSSLYTVDSPETNYSQAGLYDMEAYTFLQIASRFSTSELVHSFKVVSDNSNSGLMHIDKSFVVGLLADKVVDINELLCSLEVLAGSLSYEVASPDEINDILSKWRFSVTQEKQLRQVLRRIKALTGSHSSGVDLSSMKSSRDVLAFLVNRADQLSLSF